jgi:hypothetical protein
MTLPWDLEDWLTEQGDEVIQKKASAGDAHLTARERLIYEIWLLDAETRNGGLSQYFANWGASQWEECCSLAVKLSMPAFAEFAKHVSALVEGSADAYLAVLEKGREADQLYYSYQVRIVSELRGDKASK